MFNYVQQSDLNTGYEFSADFVVTEDIKRDFEENGFIILKHLFNKEEVNKLKETLERDDSLRQNTFLREDGEGLQVRAVIWNNPADDVTGLISRSEKVAGTMEKLLGGEIYHYHSKVIKKEPFVGGAHIWHQDYGYWYENFCLQPEMGTFWMAVDKADRNNGCLKIIPGSHKLGRIRHTMSGDLAQADLERVKMAEEKFGLLYAELEQGDAMFFHANLLHRSDQNTSPNRRWAFLTAYNRASNNPTRPSHFSSYTPLFKVPNTAILESGDKLTKEKDFFSLSNDLHAKSLQQFRE